MNELPDPFHVVIASVFLDPSERPPLEFVANSRDFGRVEAATLAVDPGLRLTFVQAAWHDLQTEINGVTCHFVRQPKPTVWLSSGNRLRRLPARLIARVAGLSPDLVHFDGLLFPRELRALRAALPTVPILAQDHGTKPRTGWRRWFWRWGFSVLDGVIFTAAEQATRFKNMGILARDLPVFEVIEGSTPFLPGNQEQARATTGLDGNPCLLWLGNLDRNKDPLMILDAVARAAPSLPDVRLHMCFRHGALLDEVRARIEDDPALRNRVTLLGKIGYPDIEIYLRAADFLVQGSHDEGSGYGIIEALACGTPPLVTDIPSFRRITDGGRFGSLTPTGDSAALARAIVDWSRRDRQDRRSSARQHFDHALSFSAIGKQLRDVYRRAYLMSRAQKTPHARARPARRVP